MLAVGLVALPETLALFAGQHDWYDINATQGALNGQYGVPCMKCHADVQAQMDGMVSGGAHKGSSVATCEGCHILTVTTYNSVTGTVAGNGTVHAAAAPECMDCHDGGANAPITAPNASAIVSAPAEAHKAFVADAVTSTVMEGANEACVGCHTHVAVDITWNKPTNLSFTANSSNLGVWTVSNFGSSGEKQTTTHG